MKIKIILSILLILIPILSCAQPNVPVKLSSLPLYATPGPSDYVVGIDWNSGNPIDSLIPVTAFTSTTGYAVLAGKSGGQVLNGGTGSGDSLELLSTSDATKGYIFFGGALNYFRQSLGDWLFDGNFSGDWHLGGDNLRLVANVGVLSPYI